MHASRDDSGKITEPAWVCPSCGSASTTPYCGNCGERSLTGGRAAHFAEPSREPARAFPARLMASLRALASPPGRLTTDWIRGRRVGYLPPLSLFLWVNVAFFVVQSLSGLGVLTWPLQTHLEDDSIAWLTTQLLAHHRPDMAIPTEGYANVFNALESVHAKSLVIVMVPAFATVLHVLVFDRRHRFRDSLTFAFHFFAFSLIWLSALFPAATITLGLMASAGLKPSNHALDLTITGLEAGMLAWYLYVALGTVFALSMVRRSVTVLMLVAALYVILKAYHAVVFTATLYSI
jgi:Protein of unknown function (DUF3667)